MIPIVVLAGGRATRLGEISSETPKFLVPIDSTRVFADIQLEWLKRQGFSEIILSVGHLAEHVRRYCGDGSRFGLTIRYVEDGTSPLGTGGAVGQALADMKEKHAAVLYGDTILDFDAAAAVRLAEQAQAYALMTVMRSPKGHACNASLNGEIPPRVSYNKASPDPAWQFIDYGFLVLSRDFVHDLSFSVPFDLALPLAAASRAGRLLGFEAFEHFREINTPEALDAFRQRFGRS